MSQALQAALHRRHIGKYRLRGKLGRGAMGVVFDAEDTVLRRPVALKVLLPPRDGADREPSAKAERSPSRDADVPPTPPASLLAEARAAASLDHPGIIRVFDMDEEDSLAFIAMERLKGMDLGQHLEHHGPLPLDESLALAHQTAEALHHAHRHGVVHGDVKPANLIRLPDGRCKLGDFGVARRWIAGDAVHGSRTFSGTPAFASPEVARGESPTPASDQYSLGCTLFMLIEGRPPFEAAGRRAVLKRQLKDPAPAAESAPAAVNAIIQRAMAKEPSQRFADLAGFGEAIAAVIAQEPRADEMSPSAPSGLEPAEDFAESLAALALAVDQGQGQGQAKVQAKSEPRQVTPREPKARPTATRPGGSRRNGVPWLPLGGVAALIALGGILLVTTTGLLDRASPAQAQTDHGPIASHTPTPPAIDPPAEPPTAAEEENRAAEPTDGPAPQAVDGPTAPAAASPSESAVEFSDPTPPSIADGPAERKDPAPPLWQQEPVRVFRSRDREAMIAVVAAGDERCYAFEGRVTGTQTREAGPVYWITFDGHDEPRDDDQFYAIAFASAFQTLEEAFGPLDRSGLMGRRIRIRGALVHYQRYGIDAPQIVIEDPRQIEIIR